MLLVEIPLFSYTKVLYDMRKIAVLAQFGKIAVDGFLKIVAVFGIGHCVFHLLSSALRTVFTISFAKASITGTATEFPN